MRVVIIGATGNLGTSTVSALAGEPGVESVLGVSRRRPEWCPENVQWAEADIRTDDLTPLLRGADVVVQLAWIFQPTHDPVTTWRNNVLGSLRVFKASAEAGVGALVCTSSVGAYSPGPKDRATAESWPTHGWPGAAYSREKAYVERLLDAFEVEHPDCRVVRLRPGFVFKREAATEQRRLFAGPLLPGRLVKPGRIPVMPDFSGLRFQVVHSADIGEACRLAVMSDARGAFNLAADPVVDARLLAGLLGARVVPVPTAAVRAALAAAWRLHLVPASPDLLDLAVRVPIMDVSRARTELGWSPAYDAAEALTEFVEGLGTGAGAPTPPLSAGTSGPLRAEEFRTGVGERP
jgi:nucleoside-diphosphate-sugar epimerase